MRLRMVVSSLSLLAGFLLSLTHAQDGAPQPPAPAPQPPATASPAPRPATPPAAPADRLDLAKLGPLQKQMALCGTRGADWLSRMNGPNGRFLSGWEPSLGVPLEGDHFLRQAGAAFALARAARLTGEERYAARAAQALLTLLDETVTDPKDEQVRHTPLPSAAVNRLGAAALLVLAVNELPAPPKDLLDRSEQMCNFIRRQARPDGSLRCGDDPAAAADAPEELDGAVTYPGQALYALAASCRLRPAAWKLDLLRKAVAYYAPWWRAHKSAAFVAWQTAAYAEAFLLTREKPFAEAVFEMNDWLLGLQYERIDPRHPKWMGGFASWADGKRADLAPTAGTTAACAESLAHACRVTRQAPDADRHQRYRTALEQALQFLATLQYTGSNTLHFSEDYRPYLVGGFHTSHLDGTLRIDDTQRAVSALALYLEYVVKIGG
jgi:hypothetical protein